MREIDSFPARSSPRGGADGSPAPSALAALLRDVTREEVHTPLAALRSGLEALQQRCAGDAELTGLLSGSAQAFGQVSRSVQALVDLCCPPRLHVEACRAPEVLRSAVALLTDHARARVFVAREGLGESALDAAHLAHCLAQVIETLVECGAAQVLLSAHARPEDVAFRVVADDAASSARRPGRRRELHLGVLDVEVRRMGGTAAITRRREGGTAIAISFSALRPTELVR